MTTKLLSVATWVTTQGSPHFFHTYSTLLIVY